MALDTLGVVSNEYRKRLLLRNLANSDDSDRVFNLGLAMLLPQQYTTQQSDTRQFIATAISIKDLIKNTFQGGGEGIGDNTTSRAFVNQDYTYNKPYPLGVGDNEPLRNAGEEITEFPPTQRKTYDVADFDKALKINGQGTDNQNIPDKQKLKRTTSTNSNISQFYWKKDDKFEIGDKKDLLSFTQSLLKNYKSDSIGKVIDQSQSRYQRPDGTGDYTKGSNVKKIDNPQELAREFTVEEPYDKISDLLRHEKPYMMDVKNTSMGAQGFPRIAPTKSDKEASTTAPTNLMFSIENLAWGGKDGSGANYTSSLPCLEKGPHGGRLMWFPPYGITITDNSTVNWATTQFVGRGEPIYTYNNAERSMTLQFKVVTDHPSVLNSVKNQSRVSIDQFFSATGGKVSETIKKTLGLKYERIGEEQKDKTEVQIIKNDKVVSLGSLNSSFSVPNDVNFSVIYSADTDSFIDNATGNTRNSLSPSDIVDKLYEVIDKVDIELIGSTSLNITQAAYCSGTTDTFDYSTQRATDFIFYMINELTAKNALTPNIDKQTAIDSMAGGPKSNTIIKTKADSLENCNFEFWQSLTVKTKYNPSRDKRLEPQMAAEIAQSSSGLFLSKNNIPLCESEYFEAMTETDRFALYTDLKKRLDYFHPAFHSITPEGFNSRLTFLLQCTRQGPSIQDKTGPNNMAFGRPPICVLRIGDFYYTKVVIDSVNISYDENLWDLNPEGIGIQPMIATIDLNMKVIGGSSLDGVEGAAKKLQNALSYHFFANTEVYMSSEYTKDKISKPVDVKDDKGSAVEDTTAVNEKGTAKIKGSEDTPEAVTPEGIYPSGFTSNIWRCHYGNTGSAGYLQDSTDSKSCKEYNEGYFIGEWEGAVTFSDTTDQDYNLTIMLISSDDVDYPLLTETVVKGTDTYSYRWSDPLLLKDKSTYSVKITIKENMNSIISSPVKFNKSDCSSYCSPCC